jgi:histidine triad (HIT) family protein
MNQCLFCKIVANEIPSYKVYEDENTLAFLDIQPVNPGHTLVIPKKHYTNLEEIPEAELCQLIKVVKKLGLLLKKALNLEGYNIQVNNDPLSGQVIPHLHFHLTPRLEGDGLRFWPKRQYEPGEAEAVLAKLKKIT